MNATGYLFDSDLQVRNQIVPELIGNSDGGYVGGVVGSGDASPARAPVE